METTAPIVIDTPRPPLSRRYVWTAVVIAVALPVIILASVLILLVSANYNFLEWME